MLRMLLSSSTINIAGLSITKPPSLLITIARFYADFISWPLAQLHQRQGKAENSSAGCIIQHLNPAAMGLHNRPAQGQAYAQPPAGINPAGLAGHKAIKNRSFQLIINTGA